MDEQQLIRQQINEAWRDFAIEADLDFITSRIALPPTAERIWRTLRSHRQPSRPDDNLTPEE